MLNLAPFWTTSDLSANFPERIKISQIGQLIYRLQFLPH